MLVTCTQTHSEKTVRAVPWCIATLLTGLAMLASSVVATHAVDQFTKLKAAQIRSSFVGSDFTDDVHWAMQYFRDGTVKSFSMGIADTGKWRFESDVFCVDYASGDQECHEIWRSGAKHQLRRPDGSIFLEGLLVKHAPRS